jgi:hypothetical protein
VVLGAFGAVRQFFLYGELIWGTVYVVLGGFWGVRQFSIMGSLFWALCRWYWVVLGELRNFPLWKVHLGYCLGGFGWF